MPPPIPSEPTDAPEFPGFANVYDGPGEAENEGRDGVRKLQCRAGETSGSEAVPLDSSGERDFLRERIALFAKATLLASVDATFASDRPESATDPSPPRGVPPSPAASAAPPSSHPDGPQLPLPLHAPPRTWGG